MCIERVENVRMTFHSFLPEARWIWPKFSMYLMNSYAGFRHDFQQEKLPSSASFFITADQAYKLYVNGKYVCRGPMRGHQDQWHYDTVDLLPYLKTGHNWISIEGHNPGTSTFSYHHKDAAGLLCSADWDNGIKIASNASDWIIFRNTAYNHNTAQLSSQLGKMEELDLRFDDRSWIYKETDYTLPPEMPGMFSLEKQQGALPWSSLVPRTIPLLQEELIAPEKIMSSGSGKCMPCRDLAPGIIKNIVADFIDHEMETVEFDPEPLQFECGEDAITFTVPASGKGIFRLLTLDLGASSWLPGVPVFLFGNSEKSVIVDVMYHQYLPDGKIAFPQHPKGGSMIALASRIHLGENTLDADLFQIMGTRHISLIIRENCSPLPIQLSWRTAVYPMNIKGNFSCSDELLNQINDISVHTQKVCSMDAFVDTPWREQSQWWGDARIQAKNTIFLSGDTNLLSAGIKSIAGQPTPFGLTYANAPTKHSGQILPDFSLTWLVTLRDLWFQTGNTDHLKAQKAQADKILSYFESIRNEDGLIKYDKRFWLFEDWSPLPKQNTPTFLNLWHIYAEERYLELLEHSEFQEEAEQLREKIRKEKQNAERLLFDSELLLFRPERDLAGNLTGDPSVHDQVLAILVGLCPDAKESMLSKVIVPCLEGTLQTGAQPSSFWATYLLDCAFECGLQKEALEYIKRMWEPMIPSGTVWETFLNNKGSEISLSHAWSAHPVSHLPELVFGLKQLESGWKRIRLKPEFLLQNATFKIPLPQGVLSCKITGTKEDFSAEFIVPGGVEAEIILPEETIIASGEMVSR